MTPNRPRVVLDTNVLISASLFPQSLPGRVLEFTEFHRELIVSVETLGELDDVLRRSRFNRYVRESQRLRFLASLEQLATLIEVTNSITACRDPRDDKFLELAVSGGATHIVSGDQDLLSLHPFLGISLVSPGAFLRETGQRAEE